MASACGDAAVHCWKLSALNITLLYNNKKSSVASGTLLFNSCVFTCDLLWENLPYVTFASSKTKAVVV